MFISEGIVIVFLVFKKIFLLLIENGHDNVLIVSGQNTVHYVGGKKKSHSKTQSSTSCSAEEDTEGFPAAVIAVKPVLIVYVNI